MKKQIPCLLLSIGFLAAAGAELVLEDFSRMDGNVWYSFRGGEIRKTPGGALVTQPGMVTRNLPGNWRTRPEWNRFNGIAFKVKGSGSADYGTISLLMEANQFIWYFPLKNRQWQEFRVHFRDFTVYNGSGMSLENRPGSILISGLDRIRFGDRWTIWRNNANREKTSYEVADLRLISDAQPLLPMGKYTPASFQSFQQKMRTGKKVSILCLGDSVTAGTGLKQPDGSRYADLIGKLLREKYGFAGVSTRSRGVGGAISFDINAWVYRDFGQIPDLVTLMVGYNDKSNGVHPEAFRGILNQWIDRVAAVSHGKTAILLITNIPGCGPRYNAQDDYAQVVREVASRRKLPCLDMNRIFKQFRPDEIGSRFRDTAHPNEAGHQIFAENLARLLAE